VTAHSVYALQVEKLRLLTANLWNHHADASALADVIAEHEPDVVLAQELAQEQAAAIERALPHGILLPSREKVGMGLALRKPATVSRLPLPHRDALCARLTLGGKSIEILNVHLSAPTRVTRLVLRHLQVRALRSHLARNPLPRVLAGDLNSLPVMPAYLVLRLHLRDAAREHRLLPLPTWGPGARAPRFLRLDHVLIDGLRVLDLRVLRVRGSDHDAILATLGA